MALVISRRLLESNDFENWKARFEEASIARGGAGCRGVRRFRSVDNPSEVYVIMDWDSHENARVFIEGNIKAIQERNPGAPIPNIQTSYIEELDALES